MNTLRYFVLLTFWAWVMPGLVLSFLPALLGIAVCFGDMQPFLWVQVTVVAYNVGQFVLLWLFWRYMKWLWRQGEEGEIPENWLARYLPLYLPLVWMLGVAVWMTYNGPSRGTAWHTFFCGPQYFPLGVSLAFSDSWDAWDWPANSLVVWAAVIMLLLMTFFIASAARRRSRGVLPGMAVVVVAGACIFVMQMAAYTHLERQVLGMPTKETVTVEEDNLFRENGMLSFSRFRLFQPEGSPLVVPESPSLAITENYPRIDGLAVLYPLYAGAAHAIYQGDPLAETQQLDRGEKSLVRGGSADDALWMLQAGECDMVFTLRPTEVEMKTAAMHEKSLTVTPIAKEALVFFVDKRNPVRELSLEQLRKIYAGEIRWWEEVGGYDREYIMAFQRPSWPGCPGSQVAMRRLMHGTPLRPPIREEYSRRDMPGEVKAVAAFRCREDAIGYALRHYATGESIKPLAVDGVLPTDENIQNGTYPLIEDVVIVTRFNTSPNVQALIDWFLSPEGQDYVEKSRYLRILEKEE